MITLNIILIVFIRYVSQIIDINFFSNNDKHKVFNVRHSLVRDLPRRMINFPHYAMIAFHDYYERNINCFFIRYVSIVINIKFCDKHKVFNLRHSLVRCFPRKMISFPHYATTAFHDYYENNINCFH